MTIKDIIERADDIVPNDFSDNAKLGWIAELDGRIALEVMLMDISEAQNFCYKFPEGLKHKPLVDFPHDNMYVLWLRAKMDDFNGEVERYENSMVQFNAAYGSFVRWFASTYNPAQGYGKAGT